MVIRYKDINKIKNILNFDKEFNNFVNELLILELNKSVIGYNKNINKLYFFRYFFWIFNNNYNYNNFMYFYKYYSYVLNFVNLINYFKINNIKYYIVFNLLSNKLDKSIFKKFINYLVNIRKIEIIFTFNSKELANFSEIKNLKLLDKNLIFFLLYLNYI